MKAGGKLKKLLSLPPITLLMLAEAFLYLAWARFLILLPFSKVAPLLGLQMQETSCLPVWTNERQIKRIAYVIHAASRHAFWESKCLDRAIAAMKMLARRRIDSTMYLGTAKGETGDMIAHAWLRSGSMVVTGAEEMKRFSVVGKFAKIAK